MALWHNGMLGVFVCMCVLCVCVCVHCCGVLFVNKIPSPIG